MNRLSTGEAKRRRCRCHRDGTSSFGTVSQLLLSSYGIQNKAHTPIGVPLLRTMPIRVELHYVRVRTGTYLDLPIHTALCVDFPYNV
jgi:hypothetical protein